jgi:hypothetical protein
MACDAASRNFMHGFGHRIKETNTTLCHCGEIWRSIICLAQRGGTFVAHRILCRSSRMSAVFVSDLKTRGDNRFRQLEACHAIRKLRYDFDRS